MRSALVPLLLLALAPPAAARVITLKFPRFEVPPHSDREFCNFVRLPGKTMDIAGTTIANKGIRKGFVSHHFLMWAYQGQNAAAFPIRSEIQKGEACLDFGPSDRDQRLLIAGSQSVRQQEILPRGLAQEIDPVDEGGKKVVGLILNSHWINSSDRTHHASVRIKVYPARGKVKRLVQPIFDVVANGVLKVPPGAEKPSTNPIGWGPGVVDPTKALGRQPIGGGRIPDGPACIVMLTAHMHKRGKLFRIEFADGQNPRQQVFLTQSYTDPGIKIFDGQHGNPPPLFMTHGQKLFYTCMHDNGMTTAQKLGCQEVVPEEGQSCASAAACGNRAVCAGGKCTNVPGRSVLEILPDLAAGKRFDDAAKRCTTDADCPASDPAYPDRQFTGKCVPANLVFGFTSDDDMCIMPGAYYDANPNAPAGQECNLDLL